MFKFLLVVHALIAASLVGVILMQRSEGGGLAGGGSPTGLLSARGAGDFLTRTTAILATLFIVLSIGIAALATVDRGSRELDNSLNRAPVGVPALPTMPGVPIGGAAPAAGAATLPAVAPTLAAPVAAAPAKASPKPATKQDQPAARRPAQSAPKPEPKPVTLPPIVSGTPKSDPAPASTAPTTPQ